MKSFARLNKDFIVAVVFGLVAVFSFLTFATSSAAADTKPYFKVYGGDVFVGGAFNASASGTNCTTGYQYSAPTSGNSNGGIFAFAKSTSGYGGASGEYDVYATGPIEGNSNSQYGFYSSSVTSPTTYGRLSFANIWPSAWGGYFDGSTPQSHCIPDYFDSQQKSPQTCCNQTPSGDSIDLNNANGQYIMTPGSGARAVINPNGYQIPVGRDITVFVNGDAYIANNIAYQSGSTDTSVTKFTLVVKGNIYVAPTVTRMDGWYIAQPSSVTATDGVLWTCHDNSTTAQPLSIWFNQNCGQQLVINGAVTARQVNFMRVGGDVNNASATPNEPSTSSNIAEVINYQPPVVVGGSYFNQSPPTYQVQSIISLPPVF